MPFDQLGKILIVVGVAALVLGLLFVLLGRAGLGRLPGDFTFSNGSFTCVIPVVSMIVLSLVVTIIVNVVLRLFNR